MGTTKFAIVGAGAISQGYAQAFQTCDEAEVVAVADLRTAAAQSLAEVLGCQAFDSYHDMSEECDLDAVLVCTPPASHPEICLHFIEENVHVLCEKPFAVSSEEALKVVNAANERGVKITMASKFRYAGDVIKAKQIVDSGVLGEIVLFENASLPLSTCRNGGTLIPRSAAAGCSSTMAPTPSISPATSSARWPRSTLRKADAARA